MLDALFIPRRLPSARAARSRLTLLTTVALAVWAGTSQFQAQAQPADQRQAGLTFELDFNELLMSSRVTTNSWKDAVYTIEAQPSRRLVQVPLKVDVSDLSEPIEISDPYLDLKGGRFLMWSLLGHSEQRNFDNEPVKRLSGRATAEDGTTRPLTDQMPYVARSITLTPNGKVQWEVERFMPNSTTENDENLYVMLVDRQKLRELHPGQPPKVDRKTGESSREYGMRQSQAYGEYRVKVTAFRDLQQQVRELPETFEADLPDTIWAIYELPSFRNELHFTGPEPLPWQISVNGLNTVRKLVGSAEKRNDDQGALEEARIAAQLAAIANDNHPYSHRVVANVMSRRGMISRVQPGSQAYSLALSILNGPDPVASNIVLKEAVTTIPPTAATRALLSQATTKLDPETKLLSLKGALSFPEDEEPNIASVVSSVNTALQDINGAPADMVLAEVFDSVQEQPDVASALLGRIRFDALPDRRRAEAIAEIISRSPDSPLAQLWLDRQLLSSPDPTIVTQTLDMIVAADAGGTVVKPAVSGMLNLVFGKPAEDGGAVDTPSATLEAPIPVTSVNHALFRTLRSGDPQIRGLAWRALPAFGFTSDAAGGNDRDAYSMLVSTALDQRSTPVSAVPFLLNQPDEQRAIRELVRLVNAATFEASKAASAALMGSSLEPLNRALVNLSLGDRQGFANRMYRNAFGVEPMVTGLLRHRLDNNRTIRWFAQQLSEGVLPAPRQWGEAYEQDEAALLELATSQDDELAMGAVATLVAMAGGREADVSPALQALRDIPDGGMEAMRDQWRSIRKGIYADRLAQAEGSYQLVLQVTPGSGGMFDSGPAPQEPIVIAIVQFEADGNRIGFANGSVELGIPDGFLAIRVKDPAQLKNFPNEQLLDIPLEDATNNVDLLPERGGVWAGSFDMPGGARGQLSLVPEG